MTPEAIAAAFRAACLAEIHALKPGNVHVHAEGHGMTVADFEASAEAAASHIAAAGTGVGARILNAVSATRERVGQNTNLGIVLLAAPLAAAAENARAGDLREAVTSVLAALAREDAALCFQAIALANPGGLGTVPEHDVRGKARITLLEAMRMAADRDRIAYQYATGFADIFETGMSAILAPTTIPADLPAIAERVYWHFLIRIPDSHIARKYGAARAEEIRVRAEDLDCRLPAAAAGERARMLLAFDAELKAEDVNPGTTADITVATVFAQVLQRNLA